MSHLEVLKWVFEIMLASFFGGILGAITGLGGGIVIVPFLTLLMNVPIQVAIGASIISIIAVSSGAGFVYVRDRVTNIRIAMFLEIWTAAGAVVGAGILARFLNGSELTILFGFSLLLSLIPVLAKIGEELPKGVKNDALANFLKLNSSYYDMKLQKEIPYNVTGIPASMGIMFLAGIISGLLGIGAGVLKVLAHEIAMKVPSKVSTATSNFMIGVTAATAAGIYLRQGLIVPYLAAPVALGVILGAFTGTRLMEKMSNARIRQVFALALGVLGIEMVLRGFGAKF
jgi:uncharacterized membrane protein YfcA